MTKYVHVKIPESFLEEMAPLIESGKYQSNAEYISELIRADHARRTSAPRHDIHKDYGLVCLGTPESFRDASTPVDARAFYCLEIIAMFIKRLEIFGALRAGYDCPDWQSSWFYFSRLTELQDMIEHGRIPFDDLQRIIEPFTYFIEKVEIE